MTLILIYADQTVKIGFSAAFDDLCCIFDEICQVITETFNLSNFLTDYHMQYYDPLYDLWINLNIHVTKRITYIIRQSSLKSLKIRIKQCERSTSTSSIKTKIIDKIESKSNEDSSK
jgi:hypothetical protein